MRRFRTVGELLLATLSSVIEVELSLLHFLSKRALDASEFEPAGRGSFSNPSGSEELLRPGMIGSDRLEIEIEAIQVKMQSIRSEERRVVRRYLLGFLGVWKGERPLLCTSVVR